MIYEERSLLRIRLFLSERNIILSLATEEEEDFNRKVRCDFLRNCSAFYNDKRHRENRIEK